MKLIAWLFIILGSNGITAALVARHSIRYDAAFFTDRLVAYVLETLGAEQGMLYALVMPMIDNLLDSLVEILGTDNEYVQLIDRLFHISIGVLAFGLVLLIIGYIRGRKGSLRHRRNAAGDEAFCMNCWSAVSRKFCSECGQKVE